MPTYGNEATTEGHPPEVLDEATEAGVEEEELEEEEPEVEEPPPLPPPHAGAMMPVAPTIPRRVLPHIKAKDLQSTTDATSIRKVAALFHVVIDLGAHAMADGRKETR